MKKPPGNGVPEPHSFFDDADMILPHTPPTEVLQFLERCNVAVDLIQEKIHLLQRFLEHLTAANTEMNLTRIRTAEDYWVKHIADSLSIGLFFPDLMTDNQRLGDVGSGAGIPAIPLAWANSKLHVTAIESRQRKAAFITDAACRLGLGNLSVMPMRAREAARQTQPQDMLHVIVARAVSNCADLIRECRPLLIPEEHSRIILYKTPRALAEEAHAAQREASKHGMTFSTTPEFELPLQGGTRQFAVLSIISKAK